jgi:hypothetical protein
VAAAPPTTGKQTRNIFGPWTGVNELQGELVDTDLEAAWNVELEGDVIKTRGGRKLLGGVARASVRTALYYDGAGNWKDYSAVLTDGRSDTFADLSAMPTTAALYVSFAAPCFHLWLEIAAANANTAAMVVKFNRVDGWHTLGSNERTDGTASGGKSLSVSGSLQLGALLGDDQDFTYTAGWIPSTPTETSLPPQYAAQREYWLRISFDHALSATVHLSDVSGDPRANVLNSMLSGANGLFQWRVRTGERLLFIGMDDKDLSVARLFILDRGLDRLRPIALPADRAQSGPDARWTFAAMPHALIACNGYTTVYLTEDDPYVPRFFDAQELLYPDTMQQQVPDPRQQLAIFFQGRIYFASGNRVIYSEPPSNILNLRNPTSAPLLGCNLFLAESNFDLFDEWGGPITGWALWGASLLIFTAQATFLHDGLSLSCSDSKVGCIAPASIAASQDAIYFLGARGVYRNRGGVNELVSRKITPTIATLNRVARDGASGAVYHARGQYRLCVASGHNPRNDQVLVYDFEHDAWTVFGTPRLTRVQNPSGALPYEVCAILSSHDGEFGEELLTLNYDGQVYLEDYGRWDDGAAIPAVIVFGPVKWQNTKVATFRGCRLNVRSAGRLSTLRVGLLRDDETWEHRDSNGRIATPAYQMIALNDTAANLATDYYDQVPWTYSRWRSRRYIQKKVSFGLTGRAFQVVLTSENAESPVWLRGLTYELIPRASDRDEP